MKYLGLLIFLICSFVFANERSSHLTWTRLARVELSKKKFKKTTLGGFSGAFFKGNKLYILSDDRGRVNEPRFYIFNVKMQTGLSSLEAEINPEEVVFISSSADKKMKYLDGEAIVNLSEKRILVSCEGDNNHKPRREPRLFEVDEQGQFVKNWELPSELLPEPVGLQKKGIMNNSGIEGLSISADGSFVLAAVERPLVQDQDPEKNRVRFYEFSLGESSENRKTYFYDLSGVGVFSGVSEVLSWKEKKFFVLERGVRPELGGRVQYSTGISLVDLEDTDKNEKKISLLKKQRIEVELGDENFEAMAWGPAWGSYPHTLWVLSDNNFSKHEKTVFLIYGVAETSSEKKSP